jgi:hypothetical protein
MGNGDSDHVCHSVGGDSFNHLKVGGGKEGGDRRTVVTLGEPEGVSCPYGDELISIVTKSMQDHILDAMWLGRAPNHDVEPGTRLRRKDIRAECGEVRTGHDAARRGTLILLIVTTV